MSTTNVWVTLVAEECYKCGCIFGLTQDKSQHVHDSGDTFYCPNGHNQHYTKSNISKLNDEIATLRRQKEYLRADVELQSGLKETAIRSGAAYKGQVTKMKNRVSKGVCPCCNRHFANLQKHMDGQHPDYAEK